MNITSFANNDVLVVNNFNASSGAAVDLAPIVAVLNQIITLLTTIIGLLPGRSFEGLGRLSTDLWTIGIIKMVEQFSILKKLKMEKN